MRRVIALIFAVVLAGGIVAPAHAARDTNWPCAGCAKAPHGK